MRHLYLTSPENGALDVGEAFHWLTRIDEATIESADRNRIVLRLGDTGVWTIEGSLMTTAVIDGRTWIDTGHVFNIRYSAGGDQPKSWLAMGFEMRAEVFRDATSADFAGIDDAATERLFLADGWWIHGTPFADVHAGTWTSHDQVPLVIPGYVRYEPGPGDDLIADAGPGPTMILGGDGNDTLHGNGGDDTIEGEAGDDLIHGGTGDDRLIGNSGDDTIHGDGGDDYISIHDRGAAYGGAGDDTILLNGNFTGRGSHAEGGDGDDLIYGSVANALILGGEGRDTIYGGSGHETILGGGGDDRIFGGYGNDSIDGGDGNDSLNGGPGDDTILGGAGNDSIHGGDGGSLIHAGAGDDTAAGGSLASVVYLGDGADVGFGGSGADQIFGEDGNDTIYPGDGADTVHGGDGDDVIFDNRGRDTLYGGAGDDTITALEGGDAIFGGEGRDHVLGGNRRDTIFGDGGDDRLEGRVGNDTIDGGAGDDTIVGGVGRDVMTGGEGADSFVFGVFYFGIPDLGLHGRRDVVTDFTPGIDTVDLSALGLTFIVGGFTGAGNELRWNSGSSRLNIDIDGDGAKDFQIALTGVGLAFDPADLIL